MKYKIILYGLMVAVFATVVHRLIEPARHQTMYISPQRSQTGQQWQETMTVMKII